MKRLGVALVVVLIEKYFFCVYLFNEKEENICRQLFPIYFLIHRKQIYYFLFTFLYTWKTNQ